MVLKFNPGGRPRRAAPPVRYRCWLPLLLAVTLNACSGNTNPGATKIADSSATLQASVVCSQGESCGGYFRWRAHGTSAWTDGPTVGPANGPLSQTIVTGDELAPATTYDYQFCGRNVSWSSYVCVGPSSDLTGWSTFTTLRKVPIVTAQQFSDSIGGNDHITYSTVPLYDNQTQAILDMKALGITHVRVPIFDWSNTGGQAYFLTRFEALQQAGFKIDAQVSQVCTDRYPAWDTRNPADCIGAVQRTAGLTGIEAFEDPNEADNNGDPNWVTELTSYDQAIYSAAKAVGSYPVYGPSLVYDSSPPALGNQSGTFDLEDFHDYTGATSPNPAAVAVQFGREVPLTGTKPAVAAETGYHNAVGCHDGCQPGIDQTGGAVYTLRTYLEHLADGVSRTFTYELYDQPNQTCGTPPCQDAHWGLIGSTGTWKPAAHALANLTAMIGTGAPATVTPLRWGVAAGDDTSDLRYLDIERPDGSHDLVLWRTCMGSDKSTCPSSVWNPSAVTDLSVAPVTIHVVGGFRSWTIGDPVSSPWQLSESGPITIALGADPIVLHITPS